MLRNATCLLIQDENNYYLTPYTDEREENDKILFRYTNTLTAITIWPHKDETNALDDVQKQLCLKFIELNNKEYASNLRATSSVDGLMEQLNERQKTFVNAVMSEFIKVDNTKWVHVGRSFSTDIVQINLKDVASPQGFYQVDKKYVDKIAFQHACLEVLKSSIGWPAMKNLSAEVTSGKIFDTQKLFHPFALQLNNTINLHKDAADKMVATEVQRFESEYKTAQQSAIQQSLTTFPRTVSDDEIKNIYEPIKKELEVKLSTHAIAEKYQVYKQ